MLRMANACCVCLLLIIWASHITGSVVQTVKNPPAMQETWVWSPGREDPLEKGIAAHSSILTWRIPWTEEPGGLRPMSHKESDTTERLGHFHALTINTMRLSLWCFPTFAECVPLQWRDETLILPLTSWAPASLSEKWVDNIYLTGLSCLI